MPTYKSTKLISDINSVLQSGTVITQPKIKIDDQQKFAEFQIDVQRDFMTPEGEKETEHTKINTITPIQSEAMHKIIENLKTGDRVQIQGEGKIKYIPNPRGLLLNDLVVEVDDILTIPERPQNLLTDVNYSLKTGAILADPVFKGKGADRVAEFTIDVQKEFMDSNDLKKQTTTKFKTIIPAKQEKAFGMALNLMVGDRIQIEGRDGFVYFDNPEGEQYASHVIKGEHVRLVERTPKTPHLFQDVSHVETLIQEEALSRANAEQETTFAGNIAREREQVAAQSFQQER